MREAGAVSQVRSLFQNAICHHLVPRGRRNKKFSGRLIVRVVERGQPVVRPVGPIRAEKAPFGVLIGRYFESKRRFSVIFDRKTMQFACFWSGWLFLAVSLMSPVHSLGEVLFSAHMAQHEILMLAAAPAMVGDLNTLLERKDFTGDEASLNTWAHGTDLIRDGLGERGVDAAVAACIARLAHRAIERGHGDDGFAAIYEVVSNGDS